MIAVTPGIDSRLLSAVVRGYGLTGDAEGLDIALRILVGYPRESEYLPDIRGTTPSINPTEHVGQETDHG